MRKSRKRQRLSRENHHRLRVISGLVFEMPLGVRRGKKNEYTTAATRPLMRVQVGSFFSKQSGTARLRLCARSEEHTSELQSRFDLVCRLLLEEKKKPS